MTDDLKYLLTCVDAHLDKFPVPIHILEIVKRVREQYSPSPRVGWKLVPLEPTPEMIEAGDELCPVARGTESWRMGGNKTPEEYWAAMLAASPDPGKPVMFTQVDNIIEADSNPEGFWNDVTGMQE